MPCTLQERMSDLQQLSASHELALAQSQDQIIRLTTTIEHWQLRFPRWSAEADLPQEGATSTRSSAVLSRTPSVADVSTTALVERAKEVCDSLPSFDSCCFPLLSVLRVGDIPDSLVGKVGALSGGWWSQSGWLLLR